MKETDENSGGKFGYRAHSWPAEGDFQRLEAQRGRKDIAMRQILSPEERLELAFPSITGGPMAVAAGIGRRLVHNPLPVALTGLGITWLLLAGRQGEPAPPAAAAGKSLRPGRYERGKERLDLAAGLVRGHGSEMGTRLAALARERPFALGALAFSAGAVLGIMVPGLATDKRQPRKRGRGYAVPTGETAALAVHSEIRSQSGGFGPAETEPEMEPAV